ncbi:GGDEF domain-containing protein [Massilia forsythiae]|uniref:diguanylate cyclase n=1 Tax=Massilia forsythiae TaxID=2728020 RepID=A0A7Z2VZA6_9BURK|nr:sensor domain-containing diguanylate cyclase [Massilia forsythiae]QJE02046.1 GGDEF domain-containing protein [Massilia forsythiae]
MQERLERERALEAGGAVAAGQGEAAGGRRSIKALTAGILAFACCALLALEAWSNWHARRLQLANAGITTVNTARALADQAGATFKMADTVLVGLVDRVETDGWSRAQVDELRALMTRHMKELPALQGLFIYDQDGRWIVNSAGRAFDGRNNADRDYFRHHRSHPGRGVHVGAPIVGRTSGAWVIPVSRRIERADGSFAGVALATIRVDYFRAVYERLDVRRDGGIVLALDDGIQLLGMPFAVVDVGRDIAASPVFARLAAAPRDGGLLESAGQGVTRMVGFSRVAGFPLVVSVARSKDDVLANWRAGSVAAGGVLVALIAGLALLGRQVMRQIRLRDRLERELLATKAALETSNASLASLAYLDGLTGLFNRRYHDLALQREFQAARREGLPLAVLMLDVDHFKGYNDRYGHPAGDACLARVARCIKACLPPARALASRYGGEEFALVLPATGLAAALALADAIRDAVAACAIEHGGAPAGVVSVSIGVCAMAPQAGGGEAADWVRRADAALYRAKAAGRNRVEAAA